MNALDAALSDGRKTRIFFTGAPPQPTEQQLAASFFDSDDHDRYQAIRSAIQGTLVTAIVHQSSDTIFQVFIRCGITKRVFACAVITPSELAGMLQQSQGHAIVESFSLQVLDSNDVTADSMALAIQTWLARCFPGVAPGNLSTHWATPEEIAAVDGMTLQEMTAPARPV